MQLEKFKSYKSLKAAAERKGIRARDLMSATADIQEMNRQRPQISKPTIMIESAEIVMENRASAKDMALYEALLAIAKDGGMENSSHEIKAETLMAFLQTDSVERLIDALVRIASTMVKYDVRDMSKRKRWTGAVPLIGFEVESDMPKAMKKQLSQKINKAGAVLHFKIAPVVREVFLLPKAYTWINLYSISRFEYKYTNALYQLLAVKAGHDAKYIRPLEIDAQELAIKMGWSHARAKLFNSALFIERCVAPALHDIADHVTEFRVALEPVERDLTKRGRPLRPLVFHVIPRPNYELSGVELLSKRKQRMRRFTQAEVTLPDHIHPAEYLPSIAAISRAAQSLRRANIFGNRYIARENGYRPKHLALWWRTTLDAIAQHPDMYVSDTLTGHDVAAALDDSRMGGVDRIFERWASDRPKRIDKLRVQPRTRFSVPKAAARELPEEMLMKPLFYKLAADILRHTTDLSSPYAPQMNLTSYGLLTAFVESTGLWNAVSHAAAAQGVNLGGLAKSMTLMAGAHPVRMRQTAKTVCNAIFEHDFKKIERVMKAIFANADKLRFHPQTGKLGKPVVAPRTVTSGISSVTSTALAEGM